MYENAKCCFCNRPVVRGGNNPWPANKDDDARCCDDCDNSVVTPARLRGMAEGFTRSHTDRSN